MAVSRKKRPNPKDVAKLIEQESAKDPDTDLKPTSSKPAAKKLGKSHPDNTDYHKTMLYLQIEVREKLELLAFQNKSKDMSDIVNALLCKEFDLEFIDN